MAWNFKILFKYFKNVDFIIVSDNIDWAKQNIIGDNIYYSDLADEIKDFCLLTSCDHNINGNSTFSWWGAWLNNNPDKSVIAPSNWFCDKVHDSRDMIPADWLQI